ncbi:hypothetical protein RirG_259640 [Rhizophagus irregularis DAOM 197198w]|uniref:Uncharacterized protein n=2 Tax=Rhizophagus irregularis TaxID=588596 RepID=A0A015I400_RHIIW|nr:hypothetical protein RirG_259640 [Rhizophagus irregularis DAOM 197198w]
MHCDLWFLRLRMLCDYRMLATGNQVGKIYFIFSCCSSDQSNGALSYIFNRQICGLCKMVRRSLSARDARILLWKSDVKSAASDNSIGLMVAIVTKFAGYLYSEKACRSRMSIELL